MNRCRRTDAIAGIVADPALGMDALTEEQLTHVATCADCHALVRGLERLDAALVAGLRSGVREPLPASVLDAPPPARETRPAPRGRAWAGAAAAILLAVISVVVASTWLQGRGIGVGPTATASAILTGEPTPAPSASAAVATPTPAPSVALPTPAATPPPTLDLSVGRIAAVVDEPLVVRTEPGTEPDSTITQDRLWIGQRVRILDGPVDLDGYRWWEVQVGEIRGWVADAERDRSAPWLVAVANGVIAYNAQESHVDAVILVTDEAGRAPEVLVDLDASATMRLVLTCGGGVFLDEWTPDGSRLLFSHAIGGCETTVGHVAADGGDLRLLGPGTAPAWRPDGELIAYGEPMPWQPCGRMCGPDVDDGPWRLMAAAPDGDPTVLAEGEPWTSTSDAAWSPDRRSLAYVRFTIPDGEEWAETGGTTELWLADGDGTNERPLVADAQAPFWSPDGRWIYFGRSDAETGESVLWRLRPDGTGEAEVAVGWMARFSPDGLVLAVATETGVVAMNPDGSGASTLIPGTVVEGFDWAPDGSGIVAAINPGGNDGLYRTTLEGDVVAIRDLEVNGQGPRWQPILLDRPLD